jgi:ribosomal protein S6--L-glutamate ligase
VAEAREALKAEFPHHAAEIDRDAADALRRLGNARLADPIRRVARAPLRKLSVCERLIGPARLAQRHHLPYDNLSLAIATALQYSDPDDPQAVALQRAIAADGVDKVLTEYCGLLPYEDLGHVVTRSWQGLGGTPTQDVARGPVRRALARVWLLLERGSPPRLNLVVAEVAALLGQRGFEVEMRYPEEELVRLDRLTVEADLYLLKSNTELALSLSTALEALGGRVLNTAAATALAKNKVAATAALLRAGVPTPPALVAARPADLIPRLANGPLVLKPYRGHYGAQVVVVDAPGAIPPPDAYPDLVFAQTYVARTRPDLKVFAIGDDLFGVRKTFSADSFLLAGEPTALPPEVEDLARRCGKALGLQLYGVDVVESADGVWVVDVNAFPGYRGVPAAAPRLADFIFNLLTTPARG